MRRFSASSATRSAIIFGYMHSSISRMVKFMLGTSVISALHSGHFLLACTTTSQHSRHSVCPHGAVPGSARKCRHTSHSLMSPKECTRVSMFRSEGDAGSSSSCTASSSRASSALPTVVRVRFPFLPATRSFRSEGDAGSSSSCAASSSRASSALPTVVRARFMMTLLSIVEALRNSKTVRDQRDDSFYGGSPSTRFSYFFYISVVVFTCVFFSAPFALYLSWRIFQSREERRRAATCRTRRP